MVKSLALFNHKGGVGKTTLTVNLARAMGQNGITTLVADCDPQCNATAFYLNESQVDELLDESINLDEGGTVWSGIARHVRAKGDVRAVDTFEIDKNLFLLPGDVLLGTFEDRLSAAWKDSFSRDATAIDLMSAVYRCLHSTAATINADLILIDVGPSIGSLNRAILLGCDHYVIPVSCDLFSLRALGTLGRALRSWIDDWTTITKLAKHTDAVLLPGKPEFIGYVTQHFNIYRGRSTTAFEDWERRIAPRVVREIIEPLKALSPQLVHKLGANKVGEVPAFHSLAPLSQKYGVPIGGLRGYDEVNTGYYAKITEADRIFQELAVRIAKRLES